MAVTRADIQRPFGIDLIASWACGDEDTRINPLLLGGAEQDTGTSLKRKVFALMILLLQWVEPRTLSHAAPRALLALSPPAVAEPTILNSH